MYLFADLCSVPDYPFCYLLGVLKKWPSEKLLSAKFFTDEFGWLKTVEEQSDTPRQTRRRSFLTRKYILPTAPLTMTPSWSPFPLAADVLPNLVRHGRSEGNYASAFAVFAPDVRLGKRLQITVGDQAITLDQPVADDDLPLENIHAQHFLWLMNMTVARAVRMRKPVIVAGLAGFGYESELERDENGETKLRLMEAGYLYPSNVPQGARYEFLTNPAARAAMAAKRERMRQAAEQHPVPPPPADSI